MKIRNFICPPVFLLICAFCTATAFGDEFIKLTEKTVSKLPDDMVISAFESLTVGPKGNVFVIAPRECQVLKFDGNLKYIGLFGRVGKGPGEFEDVDAIKIKHRLSVLKDGDVYVSGWFPNRFLVYNNQGNYSKDIPVQKMAGNTFKGSIAKILAITSDCFASYLYPQDIDNPCEVIVFKLKPGKLLFNVPVPQTRVNAVHRPTGVAVVGITDRLFGDSVKIVVDGPRVAVMNPQKFFVAIDNVGSGKNFTIQKEKVELGKFNDKELKVLTKKLWAENSKFWTKDLLKTVVEHLHDKKNVLADVQFSGDRILAFPVREDISVENRYPVEVYDAIGEFIKRVYFSAPPAGVWKNFAYFIKRDSEDNPYILRFKMEL